VVAERSTASTLKLTTLPLPDTVLIADDDPVLRRVLEPRSNHGPVAAGDAAQRENRRTPGGWQALITSNKSTTLTDIRPETLCYVKWLVVCLHR
jgi:hypothetical protein